MPLVTQIQNNVNFPKIIFNEGILKKMMIDYQLQKIYVYLLLVLIDCRNKLICFLVQFHEELR